MKLYAERGDLAVMVAGPLIWLHFIIESPTFREPLQGILFAGGPGSLIGGGQGDWASDGPEYAPLLIAFQTDLGSKGLSKGGTRALPK